MMFYIEQTQRGDLNDCPRSGLAVNGAAQCKVLGNKHTMSAANHVDYPHGTCF